MTGPLASGFLNAPGAAWLTRPIPGVDVWWLDVTAVAPGQRELAILDAAELARAAGFDRAADRHRYLSVHLMLRRVVAGYAGLSPGGLEFRREPCPRCGGPHGRPALSGPGPQFSLSHSGDLAVLAVANHPVGVDVQHAVPGCVCPLAGRMGWVGWRAARLLPEAARHAAILRWWVRAEAAFKMRGVGIVHPGPVPSGCRPRLLPCPPGYLAAIAAGRPG